MREATSLRLEIWSMKLFLNDGYLGVRELSMDLS